MVSVLRISGLAAWPLFLLFGLFLVVRADPPMKPEDQHSIVGTWSSGSQQVLTGRNGNTVRGVWLTQMFYNPIMKQFTVPQAAGISYSFTNDGHFEMAKLSYTSNGTCVCVLIAAEKPGCFEVQLIWQHGTYESNTSTITMNPYKGDGAVQTVNPCNPDATRVQMSVYSEYVAYALTAEPSSLATGRPSSRRSLRSWGMETRTRRCTACRCMRSTGSRTRSCTWCTTRRTCCRRSSSS